MNFRSLLILIAVLGILGGEVYGQDVREFKIDTVTGVFEPTHIGVEDARYIGAGYITAEDSSLMQYVTTVVRRDLDFYADFDVVLVDSFFLRAYEIKELDMLGWKRLGADYVLRLEVEFPSSEIKVYWRLFFTNTSQQIGSGNLQYSRLYWRELGHDIANAIVHHLTGEQGIFRTKIAFIRRVGNAKELFIADYDGANERQLTRTGSINISPEFSPSGEDIYFTSWKDGDPQLFKVSVASGQITRVATFPGLVAAPSISPDGNKIACVLSKDGNSEIYVLDLQGRVIKRITNHSGIDSSPSWSPDGRSIVFSSDRTGSPQIYITDSDGLNVRRLTFEGKYNDSPIWSRRGDRITFVSRTKQGRFDLASIGVDGTGFRALTEVGMNENPHFSPDGKHIVFSSTRLGTGDIYTMDLSGRNQRRLTHDGNSSNPCWGPAR
jgi:TolB protein